MNNQHGYRIETTTGSGDDFVNRRTTITVTRYDGWRLKWTVPEQLVKRPDMFEIVLEEMAAELEERHPL